MATLVKLTVRLRNGSAPGASDQEDQLFDPVRIVKSEPSVCGPDRTDVNINARVLYNEDMGSKVLYHVTQTVDEIEALANTADS